MTLADLKGKKIQYDYKNQAYVIDGKYESCNHPASMSCNCYGKIHTGETPAAELYKSGAIQ